MTRISITLIILIICFFACSESTRVSRILNQIERDQSNVGEMAIWTPLSKPTETELIDLARSESTRSPIVDYLKYELHDLEQVKTQSAVLITIFEYIDRNDAQELLISYSSSNNVTKLLCVAESINSITQKDLVYLLEKDNFSLISNNLKSMALRLESNKSKNTEMSPQDMVALDGYIEIINDALKMMSENE